MNSLNWQEVRGFTGLLFSQEASASPPNVARRLWAAISSRQLNQYETAAERSEALSIQMTLAMIYQEFQFYVYGRRMWNPESLIEYLVIPAEHVKQILYNHMVTPDTGGTSLKDVLTLDSMNRDCVCNAILDRFPKLDSEELEPFDRDGVFRLLAFPVRLTLEEMQMPLFELLEKKAFRATLKSMVLEQLLSTSIGSVVSLLSTIVLQELLATSEE